MIVVHSMDLAIMHTKVAGIAARATRRAESRYVSRGDVSSVDRFPGAVAGGWLGTQGSGPVRAPSAIHLSGLMARAGRDIRLASGAACGAWNAPDVVNPGSLILVS